MLYARLKPSFYRFLLISTTYLFVSVGCLRAQDQVPVPSRVPLTSHENSKAIIFKFSNDGRYIISSQRSPVRKSNFVIVRIAPSAEIPNSARSGQPFEYQFRLVNNKYEKADTPKSNQSALDSMAIGKINKQLATRITIALNNLSDSDALQQFYQELWGKTAKGTYIFDSLFDKLNSLKDSLKNNLNFFNFNSCSNNFSEDSDLCTFEKNLLNTYNPFEVSVNFNSDSSRYEIRIIKIDQFRSQFISYWHKIIKSYKFTPFTNNNKKYKLAWDSLTFLATRYKYYYDTWYGRLQQFKKLTCFEDPSFDSVYNKVYKFINDTLSKIENNKIWEMIQTNKEIFMKTFWFNYGYFSTNPLGISTMANTYKVFMYDKDLAALHDAIVDKKIALAASCCNLSMSSVDSLIRLKNTGSKIFTLDPVTDPVWGFNDLRTLRFGEKKVNDFEVPATVKRQQPQLFMQFDGAANFTGDEGNKKYFSITSEDSLNFVIHNITSNTSVNVNQVSQTTTNTSSFQDALAGLSASGLNTASAVLGLGSLNIQPPAKEAYQFSIGTLPNPGGVSYIPLTSTMRNNALIFQPNAGNDVLTTIQHYYIRITISNSQYLFNLKKDSDAKSLIGDYYHQIIGNDLDKNILDFYFPNCLKNISITDMILNKKGKKYIENAVSKIIKDFVNYYRGNKNKFAQINDLLKKLDQYKISVYLCSIADRSLPPPLDSLSSLVDSTPVYHSQTFPIPVYDSTRAVKASIVVKKITKKDTTSITYPIVPAVRIGSMVRFAFSAGISVTTKDYYEKSATYSGSQLSFTNNATTIGYIVGIHIYPWKYFQIDDSFLGFSRKHFWHRLSFYTGVGLPNPLKEYYEGISADLVPGFKLVCGAHLFLNTKYQIVNNQVAAQANAVECAGPFISFSIDPSAFVTLLGLFK